MYALNTATFAVIGLNHCKTMMRRDAVSLSLLIFARLVSQQHRGYGFNRIS